MVQTTSIPVYDSIGEAWFTKYGISGWEELHSLYRGILSEELIQLQKEGNTNTINPVYLYLRLLADAEEDLEIRITLTQIISQIEVKYHSPLVQTMMKAITNRTALTLG